MQPIRVIYTNQTNKIGIKLIWKVSSEVSERNKNSSRDRPGCRVGPPKNYFLVFLSTALFRPQKSSLLLDLLQLPSTSPVPSFLPIPSPLFERLHHLQLARLSSPILLFLEVWKYVVRLPALSKNSILNGGCLWGILGHDASRYVPRLPALSKNFILNAGALWGFLLKNLSEGGLQKCIRALVNTWWRSPHLLPKVKRLRHLWFLSSGSETHGRFLEILIEMYRQLSFHSDFTSQKINLIYGN